MSAQNICDVVMHVKVCIHTIPGLATIWEYVCLYMRTHRRILILYQKCALHMVIKIFPVEERIFFLPLWWMRACLCVWSKLFVHIKEAWLKNFGVPFFWILKFSRLLHVTASGVLFYTVICCFTLQFHNNKIAIENITRLLNYPATIANCHIIPTSKIAKV